MPETPQQLALALASLLAERRVLKARMADISRKAKRIRAKLDRCPAGSYDATMQLMDSRTNPASDLDRALDAFFDD